MNKRKRCAIVGIGNRAHSWLWGIASQHPEAAELVGLCDLNLDRCNDVNEAYGTRFACFTDWPADYAIHVMPHDTDDYEIRLPNIADGHGGGDFKIMDAALADIYPETDELAIFASAIHGARSTAIGTAANRSIAAGQPVPIPPC